eukprot:g19478.t1
MFVGFRALFDVLRVDFTTTFEDDILITENFFSRTLVLYLIVEERGKVKPQMNNSASGSERGDDLLREVGDDLSLYNTPPCPAGRHVCRTWPPHPAYVSPTGADSGSQLQPSSRANEKNYAGENFRRRLLTSGAGIKLTESLPAPCLLLSGYRSWFFGEPYGVNYLLSEKSYQNCFLPFLESNEGTYQRANNFPWDSWLLKAVKSNNGTVCRPTVFSEVELLRHRQGNLHVNNDLNTGFFGRKEKRIKRLKKWKLKKYLLPRRVDVWSAVDGGESFDLDGGGMKTKTVFGNKTTTLAGARATDADGHVVALAPSHLSAEIWKLTMEGPAGAGAEDEDGE